MDENRIPFIFNIDEFHLEMLPLDQDVISLDINTAFSVSACMHATVEPVYNGHPRAHKKRRGDLLAQVEMYTKGHFGT